MILKHKLGIQLLWDIKEHILFYQIDACAFKIKHKEIRLFEPTLERGFCQRKLKFILNCIFITWANQIIHSDERSRNKKRALSLPSKNRLLRDAICFRRVQWVTVELKLKAGPSVADHGFLIEALRS